MKDAAMLFPKTNAIVSTAVGAVAIASPCTENILKVGPVNDARPIRKIGFYRRNSKAHGQGPGSQPAGRIRRRHNDRAGPSSLPLRPPPSPYKARRRMSRGRRRRGRKKTNPPTPLETRFLFGRLSECDDDPSVQTNGPGDATAEFFYRLQFFSTASTVAAALPPRPRALRPARLSHRDQGRRSVGQTEIVVSSGHFVYC
ncbi:hypothetical protein GWI33_021131 [Rhynchophorus ferrugineus]|uniref:Uncharacterized protein n=1 Tax=Rhynchophorus ferrugineus TaxID=354439 RepID=A0A834HR34_RHYFE|nr:hypothetical protein GWI33_021131 [Rhynchophorus ferrugineus]